MDLKLELTNKSNAYIIKNLLVPYRHDMSEYNGQLPNKHGIMSQNDSIRLLDPYTAVISKEWWKHPDGLLPYLFIFDGVPAGFCLVWRTAYNPDGDAEAEKMDYLMDQFFILRPYRRKGIGQKAAVECFRQHSGRWVLHVMANYEIALSFWRKTIGGYMSTEFVEEVGLRDGREMVTFQFNNG